MLIQLPFFIAFYKVFMVSVEIARRELAVGHGPFPARDPPHTRSADHHDRQPVPHAEDDAAGHRRPQPAAYDDVHAADLRVHVLHFASGLVLYYLTSNLVSIGQQWFFNHTALADAAADAVALPKKKNGRK